MTARPGRGWGLSSDSTYAAVGSAGVGMRGTTGRADDFGARTFGAPPPDTEPPSAPGTLSATATSTSQIDLSWGAATDNVAVTLYRIERCQEPVARTSSEIATTSATTLPEHRPQRLDLVLLPRARPGRRPQRRPLLEHGQRDDSGAARHRASERSGNAERERVQREPDRSQLAGGDRQRRRRALPHRALRRRRLLGLRRDRRRPPPRATGHGPLAPRPTTPTACAPRMPSPTSATTRTRPARRLWPRPTPSRRALRAR